jgi:hypothetical protein
VSSLLQEDNTFFRKCKKNDSKKHPNIKQNYKKYISYSYFLLQMQDTASATDTDYIRQTSPAEYYNIRSPVKKR